MNKERAIIGSPIEILDNREKEERVPWVSPNKRFVIPENKSIYLGFDELERMIFANEFNGIFHLSLLKIIWIVFRRNETRRYTRELITIKREERMS